jgi:AAA domain
LVRFVGLSIAVRIVNLKVVRRAKNPLAFTQRSVKQLQPQSKDVDRRGGALLYETLLRRQTLRERERALPIEEQKMGNSLYISTNESGSGKALVALGTIELILRKATKVSFFRPVIPTTQIESNSGNLLTDRDEDIELILQHFNLPQTYAESFGLRLLYSRLRQRICSTIY